MCIILIFLWWDYWWSTFSVIFKCLGGMHYSRPSERTLQKWRNFISTQTSFHFLSPCIEVSIATAVFLTYLLTYITVYLTNPYFLCHFIYPWVFILISYSESCKWCISEQYLSDMLIYLFWLYIKKLGTGLGDSCTFKI